MARNSLRVYAKNFAAIYSETPNTHVSVSVPGPNLLVKNAQGGGRWMMFQFDNPTSRLGKHRLYDVSGVFGVGTVATSAWIKALLGSYNANTVTWNSKPEISGIYNSLICTGTSSERQDFTFVSDGDTIGKSKFAKEILKYCGCIFEPTQQSYRFDLYTNLTNSGTPYLDIFYDDEVTESGKVVYKSGPTAGTRDPRQAITFAWEYGPAGDYYCAEDFTQSSAVFYWKTSAEETYHAVNISGNQQSVAIPANTFPSGSTIQWYVSGTPAGGTATQTSVYQFNTYASSITPDSYPTGDYVDNRTAKVFSWHFASAVGNFSQQSAMLYWRVQNDETWNSIAASGTTQSLSVPAYTFPAGKTIEWYLSGTDVTGGTSTSQTATFKTLDYTLTVTTAPSSSDVATNRAITFGWSLSNTQGAATQKSAVLYWRVQGEATYNTITNSTATKSITVPANTFPTSSTIQWYVSVTAADNTVKSTSAATFTTVSPQITPTIYPSGSDVYSGADITFKWKLAASSGDYDQQSAVFYWRLSTTEEYRTISVAGNTQQVTVPALTFPTNATVYWYITAVDSGGHSSSTSVQNFKTSTTQITPQSSPTAGYTNPRNAITFSWYFAASGGSIPQGSASLFWREQGEESWTEVAASGSTTSVTIAANTFPVASVIEWYIAGSDSSGTSSQSNVYSFSTTASTVYAIVKSPVNSGVDGSTPITFQWTLTTADGYPASRVILQWKLPTEDEQHWHTIIDTTDAITQYTVESGTFQAGEINWRVQAYNVDSVAGPESSASFVCIIVPTITALTASNVPFSLIRWQANDQQGFQLEIDGVNFGPYSGTEKEFAVPDYFRDGVHTIRLRIIGTVDLWSEWEETTVSIENTPGEPISLQENADINVTLEWQAGDTETDFYIYRDGKLIGRTENMRFVDRLSIGTHEYTVINRLSDGNYSRSETLEATTTVEYIYLATADGLTEVNLRYRLKRSEEPKHTYAKESHLNRIAGRDYPTLTKSRFRDHTISCEAVILSREAELYERFARLAREPVVAKIRDGTCCTAVMESYGETAKKTYYRAYEFTLHEIDWEDFDDSQ